MYNKGNIIEIINDYQKEIDVLENSLKNTSDEAVRNAINHELSFLQDNQYRYKMQAKAWGLI